MQAKAYGHTRNLGDESVESAVERITGTLAAEGFGILTAIDVGATFKAKLDIDFRPYRILGACNPQLAKHALEIDAQVGLLMPCNVVVEQSAEGTLVSVVDASSLGLVAKHAELAPIFAEADERMRRALDAL